MDLTRGRLVKFKWDPDQDPAIDSAGGPCGPWRKGYPIFAHIASGGIEGVDSVTLTTETGDLTASDENALGKFGLGPPEGWVEIEILNVVGPPALIHVDPARLMDPSERVKARFRRCKGCNFVEVVPLDMIGEDDKDFECPNNCDAGYDESIE